LPIVHPIEHLRYVARASGAPQDALVTEAASALGGFAGDPTALVTACRRMVSRQLTSGAMWWLCSRMLCAVDPRAEARAAVDEINDDATWRHLATEFPPDSTITVLGWQPTVAQALRHRGDVEVLVVDVLGEGSAFVRHLTQRDIEAVEVPVSGLGAAIAGSDVVVCEASAVGPADLVAVSGTRAAVAVGRMSEVPVWMVAGVGRVLPARVWDALASRLDLGDEPWDADDEVLPVDWAGTVVGPAGFGTPSDLPRRADCPVAPELFRADIT